MEKRVVAAGNTHSGKKKNVLLSLLLVILFTVFLSPLSTSHVQARQAQVH